MGGAKKLWDKWVALSNVETKEPTEEEQLLMDLEKARQEWVLAQNRLDFLIDPELIDHAIYVLEAAEKKYDYYLRLVREKGLRLDIPYPKVM